MAPKQDPETKNKELARSLYIKLKTPIRSQDDVQHLLDDYERIIIKRKVARNCYVVFKDVEQQQKHLEKLKAMKDVYVAPRQLLPVGEDLPYKPNKKKIKIQQKQNVKPLIYSNVLLVKDIPRETTNEELKNLFPGCQNIFFFKTHEQAKIKRAKLNMESSEIVLEYIKKIRKAPWINGHKLSITTPEKLQELKMAKRKAKQEVKKQKE